MISPRLEHKISSLSHLPTARGGLTSHLGTIAHLPDQKRLSINNYIPERKLLKFNNDTRILKTTKGNLLDETSQQRWRSCVRMGNRHSTQESQERLPTKRNNGRFSSNNNTTFDKPMNVCNVPHQ